MWRAWRRIPPRRLRRLAQRSGRGGRDRCVAIDPTHFEITRPSLAYCKRTKRNPLQEPNRKATIATGTRSLKILDAIIHKDCHRRGIRSVIPIHRGVHRGFFRHKMRPFFTTRTYHRRPTVECVFSVVKGRCGGRVRCRTARHVRAELDIRAIAHNLKICLQKARFSTRPVGCR